MKLRLPIFFSLLIGIVLLVGFYPPKRAIVFDDGKESVLVRTIIAFVDQLHYSPKAINDEFSKSLYEHYLKDMDGFRRFLTQEDIQKLAVYQTGLDDEINQGDMEFFSLTVVLLDSAVKKTQLYYREILSQPFDFSAKETFETDPEKRPYAKNDAELRKLWQQLLKYETMNRLVDKMEANGKDQGGEVPAKSMEELEQEARQAVLKSYDEYYARLAKVKRSDRLSVYLNAIAGLFDPHTNYFEPIEKENFDIRFSGRLEGIGATLQTVGDFTKVASIVVGGPAWKGKELQENDLILKVAQGKEGEFQDVTGMVINDVVSQIRGKKGTLVRLQIKKVDGTVKEISIVRDVVQIDEGYAKSLILDGSGGEKIGYIYLPTFYADFNDPNGRFCSKDIAQELEKLKTEKVNGVILDLRNNGGGSLRDVQRMTGFFIESGPIVQVKSRNAQPEVLRDVDSRVQYNGPLVVMVNSLSASASEILAAALQDYGRALIVGGTTYGKGTVQRFYNLDNGIPNNQELQPLGEVKITTQKFYRVNGGSTQLKGVTPDIILPDDYQYIEIGERQEDYPLEWTQIPAVEYQQNAFKIRNMEELKRRSKMRLEKDPDFQKVIANAKRLKAQRDKSVFPLNLEDFKAMEATQKKEAEQYKDLMSAVVNKGVRNLESDLPAVNSADESKKARNDEFIKEVSKDIYIRETLHILRDLIQQK